MTLWQAVLLGVLQGVTEFLPVSSSGHLALAQLLMPGFSQPGVVFDAMLHVGTTTAVLWYERRRLVEWASSPAGRRLLAMMVFGTAATAVVAFPLRRLATTAFESPLAVGAALVVTGCVVAGTRRLGGGACSEVDTSWRQTLLVGLAQGLAVFPGLSRSGVTIAAGLATGFERAWSARFSFLLAVPAVLAASLVEVVEASRSSQGLPASLVVAGALGSLSAGLTGYLALRIVIRTVSSAVFHRFAWYALVLGVAVLAWGLW